jgi:hypothetical protein
MGKKRMTADFPRRKKAAKIFRKKLSLRNCATFFQSNGAENVSVAIDIKRTNPAAYGTGLPDSFWYNIPKRKKSK